MITDQSKKSGEFIAKTNHSGYYTRVGYYALKLLLQTPRTPFGYIPLGEARYELRVGKNTSEMKTEATFTDAGWDLV